MKEWATRVSHDRVRASSFTEGEATIPGDTRYHFHVGRPIARWKATNWPKVATMKCNFTSLCKVIAGIAAPSGYVRHSCLELNHKHRLQDKLLGWFCLLSLPNFRKLARHCLQELDEGFARLGERESAVEMKTRGNCFLSPGPGPVNACLWRLKAATRSREQFSSVPISDQGKLMETLN